jgi:phage-related protein
LVNDQPDRGSEVALSGRVADRKAHPKRDSSDQCGGLMDACKLTKLNAN